ncbi:hypothetical protein EVAR_29874_1 [Eumeta japonica]|uniref:Uncharacterized protein n=1 Tax=Eumeta variegata TaxID=151549 RepID=A0A4C1V746_EUMVA|nr:hypothetical protein EVAR_29874_1 [Eumeta japonica]
MELQFSRACFSTNNQASPVVRRVGARAVNIRGPSPPLRLHRDAWHVQEFLDGVQSSEFYFVQVPQLYKEETARTVSAGRNAMSIPVVVVPSRCPEVIVITAVGNRSLSLNSSTVAEKKRSPVLKSQARSVPDFFLIRRSVSSDSGDSPPLWKDILWFAGGLRVSGLPAIARLMDFRLRRVVVRKWGGGRDTGVGADTADAYYVSPWPDVRRYGRFWRESFFSSMAANLDA